MAKSMSNGRKMSRPAQGNNSRPVPTAAPAYRSGVVSSTSAAGTTGPDPKVVKVGSVSKPKPLPKWRPKVQAAPRRTRD